MASSAMPKHGCQSYSRDNTAEILDQQLQAEWSQQAKSHKGEDSVKSRKRKSRDGDEGVVDADGSAKKKRKKKKKKRQEGEETAERHVSGHHYAAVAVSNEAGLPKIDPLPIKVTPIPPPTRPFVRTQPVIERAKMDEGPRDRDSSRSRDSDICQSRNLTPILLKQLSSEDSDNADSDVGQDQNEPLPQDTDDGPPKAKKNRRKRGSMAPTLPLGYEPAPESGPEFIKKRYHCPVLGCSRRYTRRPTLGEHMNVKHAGQILNDNGDGTFSIISRELYEAALARGDDTSNLKEMKLPTSPNQNSTLEEIRGNAEPVSKDSKGKVVSKHSEVTLPKTHSSLPVISKAKSMSTSSKPAPVVESVAAATHAPAKQISTTSSSGSSSSSSSDAESDSEELLTIQKSGNSTDLITLPDVETSTPQHNQVSTQLVETRRPQHNHNSTQLVETLPYDQAIWPTFDITGNTSSTEAEGWEVIPGVMEAVADSPQEGVLAWGGARTTSATGGVELPGLNFSVHHLATGMMQNFIPSNDVVRICSVASGKVKVRMEGAGKEFFVGKGSMFQVPRGETVFMLNKHYEDAVVHVTTVREN